MIRNRMSFGLALLAALMPMLSVAASEPAAESQAGTTIIGAVGISESVSAIMARARVDDARPRHGPQIKYEFDNEYRHPKENPLAPAVAFWPPADDGFAVPDQFGPSPDAAQTVSTPNFTAATLADANAFPPDTMGAVGPTQFIVAINGRIRTFNKLTGAADGALNARMDTFFNSVMTPPTSNNFTSDPRIRYDRLSGRWFVIIIDVPGQTGAQANRVLIAVSSGSSITASSDFTFYQFQTSASLFADYPTLGIDANALYIGTNMFTLAGAFSSTLGSVVQKTSVLTGGPIVATTFTLVATGTGAGPYTPQGVDNFDPTATEGYFVGVDNATFSTLMLRRISTPSGTPTVSGNLAVAVPTTRFPITVPHSGNSGGNNGKLDALDDRLFAAHLRNGRLWTAHNIGTNASGVGASPATRDAARWYELGTLTTTPTLIQSGTVFDAAASNPTFYFIPSVMVSGQGHAALGFSMAGTALTANAGTVGRLSADPLGSLQTPVANYSNSTATYNPASDPGGTSGRRWGDYSYTSLDPCDDMTMWTIQEFADATNSYGVRAVRLLAPAPTTSCGSATNVTQGQSNISVPISGSGYFSPDVAVGSCRIPLAAAVAGSGLTLNSVTFNSPTLLTLNIDASAGATTGSRSLTITNPDGQTAVDATCINVVAGSNPTVTSLNRVGSSAICANQSVTWQAQFSDPETGGDSSNFSLVGGSGASVSGVTGSVNSRNIAVNVGTAASSLRLDMTNSSGISPALTNLPFSGQTVTVNANPAPFNVTGGGNYCANAFGSVVGLSGSESGVNYQLNQNGNPVGTAVAGSGSAISFGIQAGAGNYTVTALNGSTACGSTMLGSVAIAIDPIATVNSVTPAAICTGSATNISLSSSPGGTSFNYSASNTQGSVSGFVDGSANPIAQALTGSGSVTYATTATLGSCTGPANNIVQSVSDPTPAAASLPDATEQSAYAFAFTAPGSLQTAQFQLVGGALPTGMSVAPGGLLSGTPSTTGLFNFTISGTDPGVAACALTRNFSLNVRLDFLFSDGFE